jgi:hypothetical protein
MVDGTTGDLSEDVGARERELRARASSVASKSAVVVFLAALILLIAHGVSGSENDAVKTTSLTETTTDSAGHPSVKKSTSTETSTPASDRSLVGRAFGTGAAPLMFQLLLAGLAAFAAGALVQRIWLGEYGITVGPVSIPVLPVISAPAASEAIDLIKDSPQFAEILEPGPRRRRPYPQFEVIEDDRLALVSLRLELEQRLRELAQAVGLDEDIALARLPERLARKEVFDDRAARGLRQLINIGDRIGAGAKVEPSVATSLRDQGLEVLYALGELRRRATEEGGTND